MKIKYLILLLLFSTQLFAQQRTISKSIHFDKAYYEIKDMLEGKKPLSFKKALFLAENAYKDGTLKEQDFENQINVLKKKMQEMINEKGLQKQKTAGNWATFGIMFQKSNYNNYSVFTYDLQSLADTWKPMLVTDLLATKKGNCISMPYLYKILANELGAEACLALAPLHCFIKHRDDRGDWWNLEATSGTFSRTSFIIESFGVTDAGIQSGLYMKPLTEKESIALCLVDLLAYYEHKYKDHTDNFLMICAEMGLKYYPNSLLLLRKADCLKGQLDKKMEKLGLNDYKKITPYPNLVKMHNTFRALRKKIKQIGYIEMTTERYKQLVEEGLKYGNPQSKK